MSHHGKRGKRARIAALTLALALIGSAGTAARAQQSGLVGYAVRALKPDNQINDQAAYFDLMVNPGQEQTLGVLVLNRGDEDIEVELKAHPAYSNRNGVIEFAAEPERDASRPVDFSELAAPVQPVVAVPANGEAVAEFRLKMPDEPFEGIVMGGFIITKLNQRNPGAAQRGVAINNVFQYIIGVRIRESDAVVDPVFELTGAEATRSDGHCALILHLLNPRPILARGIALTANVYPEGSDEAVFTYEQVNVDMAPSGSMPYTIYCMGRKIFSAGNYRVRVELVFEGQTWQLETPLTVE